VIGTLVFVGDSGAINDNAFVGRTTAIGESVQIAHNVVMGPHSQTNDNCTF
jgi:UDP-3-O-[3-hydroxymyristoyl] glucosamine N-acyltransferase